MLLKRVCLRLDNNKITKLDENIEVDTPDCLKIVLQAYEQKIQESTLSEIDQQL